MGPITTATAFGAIVGLVGTYKAGVDDRKGRDFDAYIDWLRRQEHKQLVDLILGNKDMAEAVRVLVEDQHNEVMAKLEELNKIMVGVAKHIETFQPLASVIGGKELSDQAVSVLRQLNKANSTGFLEIETMAGATYSMLDKPGEIQINELRFIDDDLTILCEYDLLRPDYNTQGGRLFKITRTGAALGGTTGPVQD